MKITTALQGFNKKDLIEHLKGKGIPAKDAKAIAGGKMEETAVFLKKNGFATLEEQNFEDMDGLVVFVHLK